MPRLRENSFAFDFVCFDSSWMYTSLAKKYWRGLISATISLNQLMKEKTIGPFVELSMNISRRNFLSTDSHTLRILDLDEAQPFDEFASAMKKSLY